MPQPHPTGRLGLLRIPGPALHSITIRFAALSERDRFAPALWPLHALTLSAEFPGWWEFDLDALSLPDATYEYEFIIDNATVVPDPYATAITRFAGYRGLFTILNNARVQSPFRWDDEFPTGVHLPPDNQLVIYEMPVRWMSSDPDEHAPSAVLGTFDKVLFEHLDDLATLGINCIELLPIADSPQTLNWGYGTRFFFAPDFDLGYPVDARFFIKSCHRRGIRVLLDIVMNMYAPQCPLGALASPWFNEPASANRKDWGQQLFRFNTPAYGSYYAAREFLMEAAEFWVSGYHVDGFRVDDFADIDNWDFIAAFRGRATAASKALNPAKPFLVIAEDSNRRFVLTSANSGPGIVDAIWNFGYRDEIRRLLTDSISTNYGEPARSVRVQHLISNTGVWNNWNHQFDSGFSDLTNSVPYITSHDVADGPRLMNVVLGPLLKAAGLGDGGVENVRDAIDNPTPSTADVVTTALHRIFGAFAILLTSVGMPMFLAGEEFADVHDTSYTNADAKQQDPVQWDRATLTGNSQLKANIGGLIRLRTSHPALARNEVSFFYFHPQFDANNAARVFAYCRTAGLPVGSSGQVIVIANMGPEPYAAYNIPNWPWTTSALLELGQPAPALNAANGTLTLSLPAFSARVFKS